VRERRQRAIRNRRSLTAPAAGLFAAVAVAGMVAALPNGLRQAADERVLDTLLALAPPPAGSIAAAPKLAIVDIDDASLSRLGPWPWPRGNIAGLVAAAQRSGAAVVAVDVLFDGPDTRTPAAVARRLAAETGRPDLDAWAETLPDGDRQLAAAVQAGPVVLGFALDPAGAEPVPGVPFLQRGSPDLRGLWQVSGAIVPPDPVMQQAAGLGALALPGDADGLVRRVPLLVGVAGRVAPGLAAEAARVVQGAASYRLDAQAGTLGLGSLELALSDDGLLRLRPGATALPGVPTLSAADLLATGHDARLAGAIVLVGTSAASANGLRAAASDPLVPSVRLQAAALFQILHSDVPRPIPATRAVLAVLSALGVAFGLLAALRLRPVVGTAAVGALLFGFAALGLAAARADWLLDPALPIVLTAATFLAAALATAGRTLWRERRLRERFAQHLAPAVVERIAAAPGLLKLAGERREVTALFTDVEDFTNMTHRTGPEDLVAMLDGYFEGVVGLVIAHGGMIDKLVGDAVHAFFNMPLDLPDHAARAVACALAIRDWTETYRRGALPAALGFGRTRIGIESGPAIVGDIGVRAKLDYTAHGDTVNSAARLEAANKELGTQICVGPGTAARCAPGLLRPTGALRLRGLDEVADVYEPWPAWADAAWRAGYAAAWALRATDPDAAADRFAALAREHPDDAVAARLARPAGCAAP
jgi:adenylate cyclase